MTIQQDRTRKEIIESIGRPLGVVFGTATGGADTASLIDTFGLQGADDEHNGKFVYMDKTAGVAATDETWITDYDKTAHDATLAPVVSGIVAAGDTYEMWPRPFIRDDITDVIDRAIIEISRKALQVKQTTSQWTNSSDYEYAWLSSFKSIHSVEYVSSTGVDTVVTDCETVWTAGSANVTVTADATYERYGSYCAKLVEDGNSGAGAKLGYIAISSLDISDCDRLEFDMYSSIALTAGQLDFALDDTAALASVTESLDIPAMSAATWYRHSIALANPHSDTAIISAGLVQTSDVGAATYYIDNVRAVKNGSKVYKELNPQLWDIVKGSTNYLQFTSQGKDVVGSPTQIRLSGLQLPTIMTADTDTCEVDPEFVVEYSLAYILLYHAKSRGLDIHDRKNLGELHLALAEKKKGLISINIPMDSRFI